MKVLFFGQATGGNALVWFEYLNRKSEELDIVFLARTRCTLNHRFKVYSPYGSRTYGRVINKFRNLIGSKFFLNLYTSYISKIHKVDVLVLQGNYTPDSNLRVMKKIKGYSILNIYGSDFYRKYLKDEFSITEREQFIQVVEQADLIACNWNTTADDFVREFPSYKHKVKTIPWGVDPRWKSPLPIKHRSKKKRFISTRALHAYNNVQIVVEAFCISYPYPSENELHIVGSYGNDPKVINEINEIIERYGMQERVKLDLGNWYEGDELVALYDSADYNFCFGSSDQLTISITYAFMRGVTNILSPLPNYKYLIELGFKTPIISEDISVETLVEALTHLDHEYSYPKAFWDREKAINMFDMDSTFNEYTSFSKK
ncbi:hypothetical protein [Salinivibrio kushneri]|uniref:Glycosyltransferase n=1 Tax=Salinivibrio kushneri TaxID=1908198 RepID=A0AB36JW31_9GAMM|nr:hypothetical protein [Salinivibrio kushneri]OOE39372.1 hypothetical protein BZG09_16895 [Salinivibrio kushneri]